MKNKQKTLGFQGQSLIVSYIFFHTVLTGDRLSHSTTVRFCSCEAK